MSTGDVLFMHRLTKQGSLPNRSDDIRWSFDLRYQPIGLPTGRPLFPGFVARSRQHPEQETTDWREWAGRSGTPSVRDARTASRRDGDGLQPLGRRSASVRVR